MTLAKIMNTCSFTAFCVTPTNKTVFFLSKSSGTPSCNHVKLLHQKPKPPLYLATRNASVWRAAQPLRLLALGIPTEAKSKPENNTKNPVSLPSSTYCSFKAEVLEGCSSDTTRALAAACLRIKTEKCFREPCQLSPAPLAPPWPHRPCCLVCLVPSQP